MAINWSQVECEACGNCCPDPPYCWHKTEEGLCRVHPTIIGEESADRLRGRYCRGNVLVQVANRIFCPPVMEMVEKHSGIKAIPYPREDGTVWISNFEEVTEALGKLRGL